LATIPGTKANTIQTVRMCNAMARSGCRLYLLIPAKFKSCRIVSTYREISTYYGLRNKFAVIPIPTTWFWTHSGRANIVLYLLAALIYSFISSIIISIIKLHDKKTFIMTRIPLLLTILHILKPFLKSKLIYEVHDLYYEYFSQGKLKDLFMSGLKNTVLIITISDHLKKEIRKIVDSKNNIITLHDAFDPALFPSSPIDKDILREELNLPRDKWIVAYVGQLHAWKRPEFIVEAFRHVEDEDTLLLFVGGSENDIKRLTRYAEHLGIKQIIFKGQVPPIDVPKYLLAADCLVHYTPSSGPMKSYSPLKIFEYMAAGKPILAPRQPWIEEVLKDGENALLFDEDSPKDLAEKIELIKNNPELADRIAKNAKQQSAKHTYQERAKRLLEYLNQLTT
jgi:glycosyltransferase involved in cell wall biosynthesis